MSKNNILINEYRSRIINIKRDIKKMEKSIKGYGLNCKSRNEFKSEKNRLTYELDEIKKDIIKAGSKYDSQMVVTLKNREGRVKTKINDINDILIILDRIDVLKKEISDIEDIIRKLGGNTQPVVDERQQMNIVLKALRKNNSLEDAAKLAGIDLKRIVNWIHEGRNRTNKNKIYFFKQYSKIKSNKTRKINKILMHLKNGKSKAEACKLSFVSVKAFDAWYNCGRLGKDKSNIDFYKNVKRITGENYNYLNY